MEVDAMPDEAEAPSLADIPATAQRLAIAYYEAGLNHGFELGYRAAEARQEASWAAFAALAKAATRNPPYDQLCEQRGETQRAEEHRRLMRERGITP